MTLLSMYRSLRRSTERMGVYGFISDSGESGGQADPLTLCHAILDALSCTECDVVAVGKQAIEWMYEAFFRAAGESEEASV